MNDEPTRDEPTRDEQRLRVLLGHAVDDVEPDHRLAEIRSRTHTPDRTKVTAMPTPHRSWLLGAVGAAAATAAVIGGAVLLTQGDDPATAPVAGSATTSATPSDPPSATPSSAPSSASSADASTPPASPTSTGSGATDVMAVYYVGDGPGGPRLFREFHRTTRAQAVADAARPPLDPDYRTYWHAGDIVSTDASDDTIWVTLADAGLETRPAGMTAADAAAAIQSLVYTAQAAYQSRAQVEFLLGSDSMPALFGVPLEGPVEAAKVFGTLSLMSISDPNEGQEVSGSFVARGVSNGFEANVAWRLMDGDRVVKRGSTTAEGWMDEKLFPWETTVSLDGVPAGTYTFVASNDDPSGGEEGNGPDVDTRTVVVE